VVGACDGAAVVLGLMVVVVVVGVGVVETVVGVSVDAVVEDTLAVAVDGGDVTGAG
jgi:hypothetical protein